MSLCTPCHVCRSRRKGAQARCSRSKTGDTFLWEPLNSWPRRAPDSTYLFIWIWLHMCSKLQHVERCILYFTIICTHFETPVTPQRRQSRILQPQPRKPYIHQFKWICMWTLFHNPDYHKLYRTRRSGDNKRYLKINILKLLLEKRFELGSYMKFSKTIYEDTCYYRGQLCSAVDFNPPWRGTSITWRGTFRLCRFPDGEPQVLQVPVLGNLEGIKMPPAVGGRSAW